MESNKPHDISRKAFAGNSWTLSMLAPPTLPEGHSPQDITAKAYKTKDRKTEVAAELRPTVTAFDGGVDISFNSVKTLAIGPVGIWLEVDYGTETKAAGIISFVKDSDSNPSDTDDTLSMVIAEGVTYQITVKESGGAEFVTQLTDLVSEATSIADAVDANATLVVAKRNEAVTAAGSALASQNATAGSAGSAGTSAATATAKAGEASASAATASTSADTAGTQAGLATSKATDAFASANAASISAGNALSSANAAAVSALAAATPERPKGGWNAATNAPDAVATLSIDGDVMDVVTAGTSSVTGVSTAFAIGDKLKKTTAGLIRIPGVSVPGDGTVGNAKLQATAVTPDKTSFLQVGKNLFNSALATDGFSLNGAGQPSANATYGYSDYIPVTAAQTYTAADSAGPVRTVSFYNSAKTFVSQTDTGGTSAKTFTAPANSVYMRLAYYVARKSTTQAEAGSSQTTYEPFRHMVASLYEPAAADAAALAVTAKSAADANTLNLNNLLANFNVSTKNLFNSALATDGFFLDGNGSPTVTNAIYGYSDYIPVTAAQTYTAADSAGPVRTVSFYNASKVFISQLDTLGTSTKTFTAPTNTAFVRICYFVGRKSSTQIESGSSQTTYEGYRAVTADPTKLGIGKVLSYSDVMRPFVADQNVLTSNTFFTATAQAALKAIEGLELTVPSGLAAHQFYIELICRTPTTLNPGNYNHTIQLYDATASVRYTIVAKHTPTVDVEKLKINVSGITGTIIMNWSLLPGSFELWQNGRIYINVNIKSGLIAAFDAFLSGATSRQWTDKTIIWFGTSIPEGGLYPATASALVGATCINRAKGSSMARRAKKDGTYTGLAWQAVAFALTQTIAEKQDLIDNWDTYKVTLTNSPPATLLQADKDLWLSCSYENRLLPYLNGTLPMPDLFVWDHGHNDNITEDTDSDFTTIPVSSRNKNYFLGAMNFLIDLVLQYNPRARMCFIGHYENAQKTRISQAQEVLAEYWDFPLLKLWEKTGWTQQKAPGSVSLWSQAPYNLYTSGQNTAADMTIQNVWLPDRLHPHTDTSGKAQSLLGNIVGDFLSRVY